MDKEIFFQKIRTYHPISAAAEAAWSALLRQKRYHKGENFIDEGQITRKIAFVAEGLFSQYYASESGEMVIKYFFPEGRLAASVTAMLTKKPSLFTITAIEKSTVLEYDFFAFKKLFSDHPDIALFYIKYLEQHWIMRKNL